MKKIAVIGAGIAGLTVANLLNNQYQVKVFEQDEKPGGLIKCSRIDGNLYHVVGGHVFNSKRQDVLDLFWGFFDKEKEFNKNIRNASVYMEKSIGYPIEDHLYQFDKSDVIKEIIHDLIKISRLNSTKPTNFEEFLRNRFGDTLYQMYFKPYNEKIWKSDLKLIPLPWLEGKLPMPSAEEIIYNNIIREQETDMVHSFFYYPKQDGSQYLANRLAEKIDIEYTTIVNVLALNNGKWNVNGNYGCDVVVFTGNIKALPNMLGSTIEIDSFASDISKLESHGTTTVLCEIEPNPYSWIYLPDKTIGAHRIICTGNFSEANNRKGIKTATIEFTDYVNREIIFDNLKKILYHPRYIAHNFTECTYPVQESNTRTMICTLKKRLERHGFYIVGRFAEWEYYNMDAAMGAALDLSKLILKR
ncbi:MAG: NAD(P)-binding protein [Syntrophaceae bacterium]|nr:NAD(P)-binding protein [Syntrophaceae bacterium]